ncbi:aldehyde ferredoxin oxidoreductase family protein [Deltaproteobacteria bacterium]|nr:aldehyde ferredoxin oxidoreductase family protein [Deltaproteobacteria bacterium]
MRYGYTGKILTVDLTAGTIMEEPPSENIYRSFLGGAGLGVKILYERIKPKADPLGPDNILGFVTGPLTGTTVPGSGRFTVVTKSPLTGGWAESNSGGFWGPALKWAGYDAVFFSGIAEKPVYLLISGGKAELRDASHLWGKDTNETDDILKNELGKSKARVSCIGPAGESCSLIAGIVNERGRIAARSGVGAVMGSKGLKAVVVMEDRKNKITIADREKLNAVSKKFVRDVNESFFQKGLAAAGTGGGTSFLVSIGDCPTKNWNSTGIDSMPACENLDSPNMDKYKIKSYGCHACTIRCGALIHVKEGLFATKSEMHRPEYESLAALGALCLNDQLKSVIKANEICNLYGMDTIAVGGVIAYAMECYEKGLLRMEDTDDIDLTWGNGEAVVALAEKIGKREGFGAVLADGVKKASERIGKGSEKYAMHVGGRGLPFHDPRLSASLGTFYISDAQPACHLGPQGSGLIEKGLPLGEDPRLQPPELSGNDDYKGKGEAYATGTGYYQLLSSSGLCALFAIGLAIPVAELISPVTGWNFDWEEGLKLGKRILTLRQAFNAREGIRPEEFKLPKRMLEPLSGGEAIGKEINFEKLKKGYFEAMGWDLETGKPNQQTLVYLGLDKLTENLWEE